jgi:hypothetical protein
MTAGRSDTSKPATGRSSLQTGPLRWVVAVTLCSALSLAGCSRDGDPAAKQAGPVALGLYRATLDLPDGGDLPFGLEIAHENQQYVAYLINGAERVRVPEVTVQDGRIEMRMPGFENVLRAEIDDDELDGELTLVTLGKEKTIPFEAAFGEKYRFVEEPETQNPDFSGRWSVKFIDDSGRESPAIGEFLQSRHEVQGTFLTLAGDHRYLAGDVQGGELALSTFDGAHAYLYRGTLNSRGEIEGTFYPGVEPEQRFVARRDAAATLDSAPPLTEVREDAGPIAFTFPDLDGKPVSLNEPRFAGKVIVVTLGGSWSPNSHDEAAFLGPYYLQNRDSGMEVIALLFEHTADFNRAAAAAKRFRDKYEIPYTTLIAGTSDPKDAAAKLPQLTGVHAFPTTLFIDRQGRVRRIHTGFSGPATGAHHQKLTEEFDATVQQLLAETDSTATEPQAPAPEALESES